jgi:limonene-1,2-epoxide hydrolase
VGGANGNRTTVEAFWRALYARDWTALRAFFTADSIYFDVPTGPSSAAVGPDAIEQRLRLGLDPLSGYDHGEGVIVADDDVVMTEHTETWRFETGEVVTLPFVSVQRVHDGRITLWKDYWDFQTLMNGAPAWWHERLATADLSWVTDVTGRPYC